MDLWIKHSGRHRQRPPANCAWLVALGYSMNRDDRIKKLRFRAWHRGTKEADLLIGGFFDRQIAAGTDGDLDWFELLLEEQDVDIMAWALGTAQPPVRYDGEMMRRLKTLDYIPRPE